MSLTRFNYFGMARIKDGRIVKVVRDQFSTDDPLVERALFRTAGDVIAGMIDTSPVKPPDGDLSFSARGQLVLQNIDGDITAAVIIERSGWEPVDPPDLFEALKRPARPTYITFAFKHNYPFKG